MAKGQPKTTMILKESNIHITRKAETPYIVRILLAKTREEATSIRNESRWLADRSRQAILKQNRGFHAT